MSENWKTFDEILAKDAAGRTAEEQAAYEAGVAESRARRELARQVYRMRTEAGLTQTELAARLGITQPVVSSIEKGAKYPTIPTLQRIAEATGHHMAITFSQAA
jgi:DNA-binding XRE family transcriptional regulator